MKKIMLICSAGMSSSLLVQKMQEEIALQQLDAEVIAVAEADVSKYISKVDVVLLAPQVRFLAKGLKRKFGSREIPVEIIDAIDYGTMNGKNVLNQAYAMMEKRD
ncbi:PTS sugar transporter subunit IIB [Listeria valentina]|uniref:PTS sugar transporter subunit IIB n=1 Tax=Listeria valentina TaxID=2705293 RepID=UPI001430AF7E|nr:PTS sugar transporter subunit IIB [Listeria valentina]